MEDTERRDGEPITIEALEAAVRVPVEHQVTTQAKPRPPASTDPQDTGRGVWLAGGAGV